MKSAATNPRTAAPPWHFWAAALFGLAWNAWGCLAFWLTVTRDPATMAMQSPAFIDWIDSFPTWVTMAWMMGVGLSLAGSFLLLMRSRWAAAAFAGSLVAALAAYGYQFTHLAENLDGVAGMVGIAVAVTGAIALQLAHARWARVRGLLV